MGTVILRPGRERSVLRRHPWVFSGAVARVEGNPADGDIVDVRDARGKWLARGYLNRHSQIVVRLLTWDPEEEIGAGFWRRRLQAAIAGREPWLHEPDTTACRLVHAESDSLPGLVVDRYGEFLVVQFLTLGVERWKADLTATLADLLSPHGIYERSDVDVREKEGLPPSVGPLWGAEPPALLEIRENGLRFRVDVRSGQKTGFYLDQRENRARVREFCAGAEVLDGFSYTGAFGVYAACQGAARVTFVDASGPALTLAREHLALNGQDPACHEFVEGDVPRVLREFRAAGRRFDLIILDPPKFAPTAQDVPRAARAYKDINLLAFHLLRPGGILFSTSCSGAVSADLFQKILFAAALDAGRDVQIIGYLHQGRDHPVALTFPEGTYLKGLICRAR
ncbi:MAG: class I SAM-dependent rRNA methyltransferase [Anaerolineae bacterium]|nr:class I SAM-dependent rRNA methyltransferase [Anaerolineae bacterium]